MLKLAFVLEILPPNSSPNRRLTSATSSRQKEKLNQTVTALCEFDRRSLHRTGTDETIHYIHQKLAKLGLSPKILNSYKSFGTSHINEVIENIISNKSAAQDISRADLRDILSELDQKESFTPKSISAEIGDPDGKKIIICAHYDTDLFVPRGAGADDNASGVAVLLELAKRLKAQEKLFEERGLNIEFIFFGSEEMPFSLQGSGSYVGKLNREEALNIGLVINLDMLGYFDDKAIRKAKYTLKPLSKSDGSSYAKMLRRVQRYLPKYENFYLIDSDPRSWINKSGQGLQMELIENGLKTKEISPKLMRYRIQERVERETYHNGNSDHISFQVKYIPTLCVNDNPIRNPNYHQDSDTPETLDYGRMTQLLFGLESYLIKEAKKRPQIN
jgi:hypothetical protein